MSFHYSRALADSLPVDNLDGDPYALSSSIYMLVRSSWPDKTTAASPHFQFGTTSVPLMVTLGEGTSTSSQEDSPARTSAPQEPRPGFQGLDLGSGKKCSESSPKYDLSSYSSKTPQTSEPRALTSSFKTLPRSGSMRNGVCSERDKLEPPIGVKECGLSGIPTPTAGDSKGSGSRNTPGSRARPGLSLTDYVRGDGGTGRQAHQIRQAHQVHQAQLIPEPMTWPTPSASEHKYRRFGNTQQSKCLNALSGGALNPVWVEWLMGWPLEWTGLSASEMDKYRTARRQLLLSLRKGEGG